MGPLRVSAAADVLTDGIARRDVGFVQVVSDDGGFTETHSYYASTHAAYQQVLTDTLATISDLMRRQHRSLSEIQPYEYSKYILKLYSAPDRTTSIMHFLSARVVGDIALYLKNTGMNFDEVLDDPLLLSECMTVC